MVPRRSNFYKTFLDPDLSVYQLSNDDLFVEGLLSKLALKRYYKGDWHGIYSGRDAGLNRAMTSHIATLNCMNAGSSIESIYDQVFEIVTKTGDG